MRWSTGLFLQLLVAGSTVAFRSKYKTQPPKDTIFNGVTVPPMKSLNGTTVTKDISKGNWFVEAFSPYCHHCMSLAPKLQTVYEFYYTSDPLPATSSSSHSDTMNTFSRYYNFQFAKLDCIAFGEACLAMNVSSFPVMMVFQDGKEIVRLSGDSPTQEISELIERSLEIIRPGSRPTEKLQLPKVGATSLEKSKALANAKSVLKVPQKGKPLPNPAGKSIELDAESFQNRVTKTLDTWFVKFYAPWCQHCQHMAPAWKAMATEMEGKLNIGEVNCVNEKRLCKDVHIMSYPSIMLFKGAERVEYDGLRGIGDFIDFAESAVQMSNGVPDVTALEFEELEKQEEVIFIYMYDHATTSEDLEALERLPMHLIGHAKLVKTNDQALFERFSISTWPRLLVSRDGRPTVHDLLSPRDIRDVPKVTRWMQSVWQPLVPELNANNAREIMHGKYVVLGILSRDREDEYQVAKREIKNAALEWMDKEDQAFKLERQELRDAKQLRIEEAEDRNDQRALRNAKLIKINKEDIERKEVVFAWVDGIFWERWIRTTFGISAREGERVVINDEDNRRYWDSTTTGNPIVPSRTSILETVHNVVNHPHLLQAKATGSKVSHFFFQIRNLIAGHPWLSVGAFIGLGITYLLWRRAHRRSRGGFLYLDGKEGLLGGSNAPSGKVD